MLVQTVSLKDRDIGPGHPPYVVAELSANHNGSLERALELVDAAADAGADAVKLQTYTADTITLDCNREEFQITEGLWAGKSLYELYKQAHTPWEWHEALFARAQARGIASFSSPFDFSAVDYLEKLNVPAYKIASLELVDLPLLRRVAATGKPIVLSTGASTQSEIEEAVEALRGAKCHSLILLHCVSAYPASAHDYDLTIIPDMMRRFNVPVGLSDHTLDNAVAVASVALGACMIEKHFTLSRKDSGPDSSFSLDPHDLKTLCRDVRTAWSALGNADYGVKASEQTVVKYRRSLYVVNDMRSGEKFTRVNLRSIRPGLGLSPKHLDEILGKCAACDIARGTPLSYSMVEIGSPNF